MNEVTSPTTMGIVMIGGIDFHRIHVGRKRTVRFTLVNCDSKSILITNLVLQHTKSLNNSTNSSLSSSSTSSSTNLYLHKSLSNDSDQQQLQQQKFLINSTQTAAIVQPDSHQPFTIPSNIEFPIVILPWQEFESHISFSPSSSGWFTALLSIHSIEGSMPKIQQISLHGEGEQPSTPTQIIYKDNQSPLIIETPKKYMESTPSNSNSSSLYDHMTSQQGSTIRYPIFFDEDCPQSIGSGSHNISSLLDSSTHTSSQHKKSVQSTLPNTLSRTSSTTTPSRSKEKRKVRWNPLVSEMATEGTNQLSSSRTELPSSNSATSKTFTPESSHYQHQQTFRPAPPRNNNKHPTQQQQQPRSQSFGRDHTLLENRFEYLEKKLMDISKLVNSTTNHRNIIKSDQNGKNTTSSTPVSTPNGNRQEPNEVPQTASTSTSQQDTSHIHMTDDDWKLYNELETTKSKVATPAAWKNFLRPSLERSIDHSLYKYEPSTPFISRSN
ncbi:hypothetical protein SAMD00019534_112950, partial [Acytostelium subglobosum LB1]|uniref:hypothetical protein n=1 Tax=Acytostelium subglobosum LB1 TaxID=1410327 RepID=UPI0006447D19